MNRMYSTDQVAKELGVTKKTLRRWLIAGELPEPSHRLVLGKVETRLWTEDELIFAKAYKEQNYRKRS